MKFDIDANGIVNVTAKDLGTNKEQKITIQSSTGLTDEEIDKMVKEAEANKEADEKRKEEVEIRNNADSLVFQTEKALKDLGDKVSETEKKEAESKMEALKEALKGSDLEEIKKKTEELEKNAMDLATKVYQQSSATSAEASNDATDSTKNSDVEEASYEEK